MDNLAMDVIRAHEAGMHYGAWKALHQKTEMENKPLIKEFEAEKARNKRKPNKGERVCPICKKIFVPIRNAEYCSMACRKVVSGEKVAEAYYNKRVALRATNEVECAYCGKKFTNFGSKYRKYCSETCKRKASVDRTREYRRARREKERANGR